MTLSHIEVTRRFPEVLLIQDSDIRDETMNAIQHFPDYFWTVPASSSKKYHNPYGRMEHGLWIHVKMAFAALNRIVDSYVQQGLIDEHGADCARSAILLHDMFKQGMSDERLKKKRSDRHTVSNHDILAADWVLDNTDLPEEVADAIASHNGPWYDGTQPADYEGQPTFHIAMLVHTADMIASSPDITVGVYDPAREIAVKYPTLPNATLL